MPCRRELTRNRPRPIVRRAFGTGRSFWSAEPLAMSQPSTVAVARPVVRTGMLLPAILAFLFGSLLLAGAGFAQMDVLHNAAHDVRHSNGFPCH